MSSASPVPIRSHIINDGIISVSKKMENKPVKPKINVVLSEEYSSILPMARQQRRWAYEWNVTNSFKTIEYNLGKQLMSRNDKMPDIIVINLTPEFMHRNSGYLHLCFEAIAKFASGTFTWKHINTKYKWTVETSQLSVWVITSHWPRHPLKYRMFEVREGKFRRVNDQALLSKHEKRVDRAVAARERALEGAEQRDDGTEVTPTGRCDGRQRSARSVGGVGCVEGVEGVEGVGGVESMKGVKGVKGGVRRKGADARVKSGARGIDVTSSVRYTYESE